MNVHTGRGVGVCVGRGGRGSRGRGHRDTPTPTPTHCTPTTHTHNTQHRTRKVASSETFGSFPFLSLRIDREQHVPDSSNHSLYLIKLFSFSNLEEHCGGNQPPDGSICLSPPKPKYNERFARLSTMVSCFFCCNSDKYILLKCHHES